jgi:hypothetical protein
LFHKLIFQFLRDLLQPFQTFLLIFLQLNYFPIHIHIILIIVLDVVKQVMLFLELCDGFSGLGHGDGELLGGERGVGQEGGWFLGFDLGGQGLELFF